MRKRAVVHSAEASVYTQANLFFRKCFIAPIYRPDVAPKSKMSPAETSMSQKKSYAEVKNSPDPFPLSFHRLDDCEICQFHFPNRSRRCLHQWNVFVSAPFFVLSGRRPDRSCILVKAHEDLLHVQNKYSAIRLSEWNP